MSKIAKTNRIIDTLALVNKKAINKYKTQLITKAMSTASVIIQGALKGFL